MSETQTPSTPRTQGKLAVIDIKSAPSPEKCLIGQIWDHIGQIGQIWDQIGQIGQIWDVIGQIGELTGQIEQTTETRHQ